MINKKLGLFALTIAVLGFTACLKEGADNIDPSKGTANVVEFANTGGNVSNTATSTYPRFNIDLGVLTAGQVVTFPVHVSYSGVDAAPEDITVNLKMDSTGLKQYNVENSATYALPAAAVYSLPASVVIPKGSKTATVNVTVTNNASFDFNKSYGLPIRIASVSKGTISSNFGLAVFSFGARNAWDGVYTLRGYAFRADATSALQGAVGPKEVSLVTSGATSVTWSGSVPWANAGNSNLPAGYEPIITLNTTTNALTLGSSGNFITANPTYNQRYVPATKTFYIQFYWGAGAASRLHTDTLTYLRSR